MSETKKTPRNVRGAPHFAVGPISRPMRQRAGALMMGTALTAIVGMGYGRRAYAQGVTPSGALSQTNATTVEITGPGTFETQDGFSVAPTDPNVNGITITTLAGPTSDTEFTDDFASSITGYYGIYADHNNDGSLSITTDGTVNGLGIDGSKFAIGNGIYVNADDSTGSVKITAAEVYGTLY